MPESAIPALVAIVAAFSLFIIVIGGVSIWTYLPSRNADDENPGDHE